MERQTSFVIRESQIQPTVKDYYTSIGFPRLLGASMGVPTHDKVMWESSGGQGKPELEGCPLWACLSVYLKTRVCLFYCFMTFTNSSDSHRGLSPTTFSLKEINLKLQLISLLGIIGVFQSKPLRWLSNLPDRFTWTPTATHTIVYSLPTARGTGSLRYSNSIEPLGELEIVRLELVDFIVEPMLPGKFPHPLYCILKSVLINIVGTQKK